MSEILFRAAMADLAEHWMQRALDQETSPQLHHLMECYRLMWRYRFREARTGFMELPPETHLAPRLQTTLYSVSDGLLHCAIGLEDWIVVIDTYGVDLGGNPENFRAKTCRALGLERVGRQNEAQAAAGEVVQRGVERMERPAQPDIPWDVPLYVAWAYRFLGDNRRRIVTFTTT